MHLEWIRTFKAVFEKGSATAAAEVLLMSQPGVSTHLSSLENLIGYPLFERRPRLLIPTERGIAFYNRIVEPMGRLEEISRVTQRSPLQNRCSVSLGMCFETFQHTLEAELPDLPFDVILAFGEYRELLLKVEQRVADLVVTPHRLDLKNVVFEPFSQERIVLVAGRNTDVKNADPTDPRGFLDWMMDQRWYGVAGENEHFQRFWKLNFKRLADFRPNFIVPNFLSIIRILSKSPGLAIIPDFLARTAFADRDITLLWEGRHPLINTLHFAQHKKASHPELLKEVKSRIARHMPPLLADKPADLNNSQSNSPKRLSRSLVSF